MLHLLTASSLGAIAACLVLYAGEERFEHGQPWERALGRALEWCALIGCIGMVVAVAGLALSRGMP